MQTQELNAVKTTAMLRESVVGEDAVWPAERRAPFARICGLFPNWGLENYLAPVTIGTLKPDAI